MAATLQKITPMLWFDGSAEEAARYYVDVFDDAEIIEVRQQTDGSDGSTLVVEFTLAGQRFTALDGGPMFSFTPAVSFVVDCTTQEEVDYYWDRLGAGGPPEAQICGWLKDRFGVSWQIIPRQLLEYVSDPDLEKAQRATRAMLEMKKIDIETLRRAYEGKDESRAA